MTIPDGYQNISFQMQEGLFIDFCLAYPYIINSTSSQKML